MYFSLQESGELLQGQDAPASGLYFDCDELPADWYAQLRAALAKDKALEPEDTSLEPEDSDLKPEGQKKATVASKVKPAPQK